MEGRAPEHMDEDLCRQPLSAEEDLGFAQARGTPAGSISTNQQEDAPHVKLCPPAAWKPLPSPGAGGSVVLTSSKAHVGQPRSADTNRTQSKRSNISSLTN